VVASLGRLSTTTTLAGFGDRDVVIEAVVENEAVKVATYQQLQEVIRPDTILASKKPVAYTHCSPKALKDHPGIEGDLDVKWTIDPTGAATDVAVDQGKSSIHEETVGNCIVDVIKKIKFAASAKGFETHAHYPFNFHPKNGPANAKKDGGS